jgi:preprotein translocase subunit SecD
MVYIPRWQIILILVACLLGVVYAAPNFLPDQQREWLKENLPSWAPGKAMNLGLDLRGGSHLLMEVGVDVVVRERLNALTENIRTDLRQKNIGYVDLAQQGTVITFTVRDPAQAAEARETIRTLEEGTEVTGEGAEVRVTYTQATLNGFQTSAIEQSIEIVRRRVDETGTTEPTIVRQGADRILLQLPGINDPQRVKRLLGQTAKMSFHLVDETVTPEDVAANRAPAGTMLLPSREQQGEIVPVRRRVNVTGETLVDAQPSFQQGMPVVSFRFDSVGARRFGETTKDNVNRRLAIVLDGEVISAPNINEPILGGRGIISGSFTVEQAQDLALLLRAGALPAPLKVLEERSVGPSLGIDSINSGVIATIVALGLIAAFTIACYGRFGIYAVIALAANLALLIALMSLLQATLTLPGIIGIVLTIGMAVDANVLVFERIHDEIGMGRSPISAIDVGYNKAMSAIIDANLTTLVAGIVLYAVGTGPVRGFAVTLTLGLVTSYFTAIYVTRLMVVQWLRSSKPATLNV